MRGRLIALAAVLVLAVPGLLLAKSFDLYTLFPNLILGSDPGGTDSVTVECAGQTTTTLTMAVYVHTDNTDPADSIAGVELELHITADQPGATLDTTDATVFTGSAVEDWSTTTRGVNLLGGDDGVSPDEDLKLGAAELGNLDVGAPLYAGSHLFATLRFNISSPTNFTVCGKTIQNGPATLATVSANGYSVNVVCGACGPIVPTLSEWGLILFGLVLFGSVVWYLRRQKLATAAV